MNKAHLLKIIKKIFKKEEITAFDQKILEERLNDDRKNSVVSVVTSSTHGRVFFKAIKPWADTHKIIDYQKGMVVYEIMKKAGVSGYPQIISFGEYEGVYYLLQDVLQIENTLSDEKIRDISASDAERILELYQSNQKKLSSFLTQNPIEAKSLFPYDRIAPSFGFLGMIELFERQHGLGAKGETLVRQILDKHKGEYFNSSRLFLLHGDFAPHNIIFGDSIYFVDWERGFVTFNPLIGQSYDLANLYIACYKNPQAQKVLYQNSLSFKLCLMFHLLSKLNNITMFGDVDKNREEIDWMKKEYNIL